MEVADPNRRHGLELDETEIPVMGAAPVARARHRLDHADTVGFGKPHIEATGIESQAIVTCEPGWPRRTSAGCFARQAMGR